MNVRNRFAGRAGVGLASGPSRAQLAPFVHNMHTALWVLAAVSLVDVGVSMLRPPHEGSRERAGARQAIEESILEQVEATP